MTEVGILQMRSLGLWFDAYLTSRGVHEDAAVLLTGSPVGRGTPRSGAPHPS